MSRLAQAAAAALALACGTAAADRGPLRLSADLGQGFDSNAGNSQHREDVQESGFTSAGLGAELQGPLTPFLLLQLRGSAQGEHYAELDGLSNARGTLLGRGYYRADGDFFTPLLAVWVSAAVWEFDSDLRDSNEYRGGVFVVQQLTTRLSGRVAAAAVRRDADSRVFDLRGYSGSVNLDWNTAFRATVYAGYQYYRGDVVSTGAPDFATVRWAEVIEPDDAFGGFAANQFAYRLEADAHIGTLGFNLPLSRHLSFDLQGQSIATEAEGDLSYRRWLGSAALLARF